MKVTRWVTECILAQEDLKKRAKIVQHFVTVAEVRFSPSHRSRLFPSLTHRLLLLLHSAAET